MADTHPSKRHMSPWLILAIVSLPVFIGALDLTIISAVLPEVITSLNLPVKERLDEASWAVNGYLLAYAISMTFTGRLSDIFGRRAVYIACLIIFMVGSYFVTIYDSELINGWVRRFYNSVLGERPPKKEIIHLYLVIAGRVVQAFGAGAMVPVTLALAGDLFPPTRRAKPLGVIGAVDTMGWVLGHLYGGVMVRFFGEQGDWFVNAAQQIQWRISKPSWETLFILNIPISLLALLGAWWALRGIKAPSSAPESVTMHEQPRRTLLSAIPSALRNARFDILGALCITLALIGMNLGLGTSPESAGQATSFEEMQGTTDYTVYFLMGAGIAFVVFLLVESWVRHPLVRLGMFRKRNFTAASLTNLLVGFCLAIGLVTAPLVVNLRADTPSSEDIRYAAFIAGILLSGLTVPMALAAIPGGWLSDRYGYRWPTALGLGLAALGFVLTGLTWEDDTSYWIMGAQMIVIGVGLGLTISPVGTAVLNDAEESERGVASALILILRLVGMTIAISSLTIFALERQDKLVAEIPMPDTTNLEELAEASSDANLEAAVQAVNELQIIGAGVSALALMLALVLQGGRNVPQRHRQTHPPPEERGGMAPVLPDR